MTTYKQLLDQNWDWACDEGDRYFSGRSATHLALRKIVRRLDEASIPYAVIGALAMYFHGFRRFTVDVDLVLTREDRRRVHNELLGEDYIPAFLGSKHIRDTEHGVQIDLRATDEYPGDGNPQSVTFPDPTNSTVEIVGLRVLSLPRLVEVKLAAGMSKCGTRLLHHADVIELIKKLRLSADFAEQLHVDVRGKYEELWRAVKESPRPEWEEEWEE